MVLISTSMGDIRLKLDEENTPNTAANFMSYIRNDFYKDTLFHRVIDGFMIQGGGLNAQMETKPTEKPIQNEAKNAKKKIRGEALQWHVPQIHTQQLRNFLLTSQRMPF